MLSREITPEITIADQPTEAEFAALKAEGYAGIINLRHGGEPEQPLDPAAEGERVRALGMEYLHEPIGGQPFTDEAVNAIGTFLDEHAGNKVLVHCRKGGRAVALVLIHQALKEGWPADQAVAQGQQRGLGVEGGLRALVEQYLVSREARS